MNDQDLDNVIQRWKEERKKGEETVTVLFTIIKPSARYFRTDCYTATYQDCSNIVDEENLNNFIKDVEKKIEEQLIPIMCVDLNLDSNDKDWKLITIK